MQRLIILIIFCFQTFIVLGQKKHFYYYHGEKIFLEETNTKILVKIKDNADQNKTLGALNIKGSFKQNAKHGHGRFMVMESTTNDQTEKDHALALIQNSTDVEVANYMLHYDDGTFQGYTDEFIVKLLPSTNQSTFYDLVRATKCKVIKTDNYVSDQYLLSVAKSSKQNAIEMANYFFESGLFEFAEPNFFRINLRETNDPLYANQWDLKNTGQLGGTAGDDINVEPAWQITRGRPEIVVAVVDEGVDPNHPDIAANLLPGYDATGNGSNGAPTGNDAHGTACAGIIAAIADNGIGVAGIAPNCRILPIRSLANNSGQDAWLADGINYAANHNADVISNSWGGGSPSTNITNAINNATTNGRGGLGCVVLFAAGNFNTSVSYPANLSNVIAVGAMSMCNQRKRSCNKATCVNPGVTPDPQGVTCDGEDWWGSNFGPELDVMAPGVKITTLDISGSSGYSGDDYFSQFNGTSSACPHAAGVAALMLSANRCLTNAQASAFLQLSTSKPGSYCYNRTAGHNFGGWNNEMGYGRVDAYKAVQFASGNQFNTFTNLTGTDQGASGNFQWVLTDGVCSGLAAGTYIVKSHKVQKTVTYPSTQAPTLVVSSNGFSIANPNDGKLWGGSTNVTPTSAVVFTFVYEVTNILGQTIGWVPQSPANVRFDYTVTSAISGTVYLQNQTVTGTVSENALNEIWAGNNVTSSLPQGNYIIQSGANVTVHGGNNVFLEPGFQAKSGSVFHAINGSFVNTCTQFPNGRMYFSENHVSEDSPAPNHKSLGKDVVVSPNPFTNSFKISYGQNEIGNVRCSLMDLRGVELKRYNTDIGIESGQHEFEVKAEDISSGVYILQLVFNNNVFTCRVVKE